jgi:hypothetical protein
MLNLDQNSLERFENISGNLKISKVFIKNPENSAEASVFSEIKSLANERNCDIIKVDEIFELEQNPDDSVCVFGNGEDISNETLICINFSDLKIRFLANGFDNAVNCDVAVLTSDYANKSENLNADKIYVLKNSVIDSKFKNIKRFKNNLKIEFSNNESEFTVYEH